MAYLIDTNILLRSIETLHPKHAEAVEAVAQLLQAGETVCVFPQNIAEFWNVCTRPADKNGLGLTIRKTNEEVERIESLLNLIPDITEIYSTWKSLVVDNAVKGVQVHDARIAAAMITHGIENIVTFNTGDFVRYSGITQFSPDQIIDLCT